MKGEEWKNAWPECWERGLELGIPRSLIGRWVHRHPVDKVAEALRAAESKSEPVSYVIGVLSK